MNRRVHSRSFDEIFIDSLNLPEIKRSGFFISEKKKKPSYHSLSLELKLSNDDLIHDEYFNMSSEGEEMEQLIISSPKKYNENAFHFQKEKRIAFKNLDKLTEKIQFIDYERTKEMEEVLIRSLKKHFYFRTLTDQQM